MLLAAGGRLYNKFFKMYLLCCHCWRLSPLYLASGRTRLVVSESIFALLGFLFFEINEELLELQVYIARNDNFSGFVSEKEMFDVSANMYLFSNLNCISCVLKSEVFLHCFAS